MLDALRWRLKWGWTRVGGFWGADTEQVHSDPDIMCDYRYEMWYNPKRQETRKILVDQAYWVRAR